MSKRKRHAPVYEGEQSGTKRLRAPDEMKIGPTSSRGRRFAHTDAGIKTSGMSDQMRSERKSDTSMRTPSPYGRSKSPVSRSVAVPKAPPDRKSPQPVASYQKARGSEDSAREDSDVIIVKEDLAKDKSRLEKERERRDARDSVAEQSFRSQEPMSAEQLRNLQLQQQLTLQQQYYQPFMQGGSIPEMVKNLGQLAYLQGIADPKAAFAAQWQIILEQEKQRSSGSSSHLQSRHFEKKDVPKSSDRAQDDRRISESGTKKTSQAHVDVSDVELRRFAGESDSSRYVSKNLSPKVISKPSADEPAEKRFRDDASEKKDELQEFLRVQKFQQQMLMLKQLQKEPMGASFPPKRQTTPEKPDRLAINQENEGIENGVRSIREMAAHLKPPEAVSATVKGAHHSLEAENSSGRGSPRSQVVKSQSLSASRSPRPSRSLIPASRYKDGLSASDEKTQFQAYLAAQLGMSNFDPSAGIKTSGMSDQMRSERKSDTSMRTPSPYGRSKSPVSRSVAVPKAPPYRKSPQPVASYQKARGSEDSAREDSDVIIVKEDLAKDKSRLEKERERRDARDSVAEQSFRSQEPMSAEQLRNLQLQQQLTLQQQYYQPFMQGGSIPEMVKNLGQLAYLQGIADPKAAFAAQWQIILEQEKQRSSGSSSHLQSRHFEKKDVPKSSDRAQDDRKISESGTKKTSQAHVDVSDVELRRFAGESDSSRYVSKNLSPKVISKPSADEPAEKRFRDDASEKKDELQELSEKPDRLAINQENEGIENGVRSIREMAAHLKPPEAVSATVKGAHHSLEAENSSGRGSPRSQVVKSQSLSASRSPRPSRSLIPASRYKDGLSASDEKTQFQAYLVAQLLGMSNFDPSAVLLIPKEEPASKISKTTSSSNPSDADHAEDATSGISNDGVQRIKEGEVNDYDLEELSMKIVEWKTLARRLQFLAVDIGGFDMDNESLSEKVYMMLNAWKQREGSGATYPVLYDALCHPLVNRQDLAKAFCIYERPFLSQIPSEITAQGPRAVRAFENALKNGEVKVYRGRIMFVGQDRAGKTSLKKSFQGLPFSPTQCSTDGIDVDCLEFEYEGDQVKNWRVTDETFGLSQHLNVLAKKAAIQLKKEEQGEGEGEGEEEEEEEEEEETKHHLRDVPKDEVPDMEAETMKTKEARESGGDKSARKKPEIPELLFDPAVPPDEFMSLLEQSLKDVDLLTDANTGESHFILDLWDFAGQDLYYASHPTFLTQRAVYMLVYNLNKGLKEIAQPCVRQGDQDIKLKNPNQETNIENLLSWLVSICSLRSSEEIDEEKARNDPYYRPPVFIVGTHADTPCGNVDEMLSQIDTEISNLEKSLKNHVIDCFSVDNERGSSDERFVKLKNRMVEVLNKEPYMGEARPIRWFNFEKVISALKEGNVHYLEVEQIQAIARDKCFVTDEDEFNLMMNFFHDLGIIVKHANTVVVNAHWLIDVFRKLITIPNLKGMDPVPKNEWKNLQNTGILSTVLVDHVFRPLNVSSVVKKDILSLMEHFGLISKFSTSSGEKYYVPAQMRVGIGSLPKVVPSSSDPCPLYIDFDTGFVPHGVFAQIVCRSISWISGMEIHKNTSKRLRKNRGKDDIKLSQNGAFFIIRRDVTAHRLKLVCKKRFIKIVLKKEGEAQQIPDDSSNEMATEVREFLENTLEVLADEFRYLHGLQYSLCVACPSCVVEGQECTKCGKLCCKQDTCLDLVDVYPGDQMFCTVTQEAVKVNGIEQWFPKTTKEGCPSTSSVRAQSLPDNIKEGQPTDEELELLSRELETWKPLGRQLGFKEAQLISIHKDNEEWPEKKIQMLIKWKQRESKDATYRVLYRALCYSTVERTDLAQTFCCHQLQETCISTK